MAKQRFGGFVGFVSGGIDVENVTDQEGDCQEVRLFRRYKDAAARYEDVREVTITVERRAHPTSAEPR